MALTGLDIYKQLPKKNCGECGPPTCLAFAMALAAGKASLESCPYVTEAAKEVLASASAPPIRLVKVGPEGHQVDLGDETVIFRHDKTFVHQAAVAVRLGDDVKPDELRAAAAEVAALVLERVGQQYRPDMIFIEHVTGDAAHFKEAVLAVAGASGDFPLVLAAEDPACCAAALEAVAARRPLLYPATAGNFDAMLALAQKHGLPLAVRGNGLDETAASAERAAKAGHKDLVLDFGRREPSLALADLTQARRLAIKKRFRPLGHPVMAVVRPSAPEDEVIEAVGLVAKYASMVVLRPRKKHELMPLFTWRQNLYTDPQKPIQVEPKLYQVGQVTDKSPVYVTTNFSLTYYSVEGEVEASKVPAYIIAVDTDGTSVLTSWAAGKFTGEAIAEAIKKSGVEEKVAHRECVLPGHVAILSGKLQEASGWKVVVGPREAAGIPSFARQRYA
jgi:acetyl-CoA decarbonylase/synthase complex subunit gamma